MMFRVHYIALLLAGSSAAICNAQVAPLGTASNVAVPAVDPQAPRPNASIGPLDHIKVSVFREPELSVDDVLVDESGKALLPLVGTIAAAGKSTETLAAEVSGKLRRYLRDPQVTVTIRETAKRQITVAGSVVQPGVYPIEGRTTLLQAIALAKGPSPVASLGQALIFRTVNGRRTAARFNLDSIARGSDPDPEVVSGDVVAMGSSRMKTAWRDVLLSLRSINVFRVIP